MLFLDEPTTGLDPEARAEMWAEIERLAADEQVTVLLTTHYLDEADRLADRLAIVDRGRVVVEGTPDAAQARAARRHRARRAGRRRRGAGAPRRCARVPGLREVGADGHDRLRARARQRGAARSRPCSPRSTRPGSPSTSVTVAPAVARRRLPAARSAAASEVAA